MDTFQMEGVLKFFKNSEQLKDTTRSAYTSKGRHESSAEHSWRLCLMAVVLEKEFQRIDIGKLLKLCIIHDLGEAINGDIPAVLPDKRRQQECGRTTGFNGTCPAFVPGTTKKDPRTLG